MTETPPPGRRRGRLWISVGEGAAVIAVIIAALGYWDAHSGRIAESRQAAQAAAQASAASQARAALVLKASADNDGGRLTLQPVSAAQVIQSQRYVFPSAILDHPMEIDAARPQIDRTWVAAGLEKALDAAHVKRDGEALMPVAIVTDYVEDGETRQDRSLYQIGYAWRGRFLAGRHIVLQGLAFQRRQSSGDLQAIVNRAWRAPGR